MAHHEPPVAPHLHPVQSSSSGGTASAAQHAYSLASLSRNTSVISSSSSSSSTSSLVAPVRPRPPRSFSQSPSPPGGRRARSPNSPTTPRQPRPPTYLTHQLGLGGAGETSSSTGTILPPIPQSYDPNRTVTLKANTVTMQRPPIPRTRTSSAVKRQYSPDDFEFGEPLGEGSYSTVSTARPCRHA